MVFSTNKVDHHDITEILLSVAALYVPTEQSWKRFYLLSSTIRFAFPSKAVKKTLSAFEASCVIMVLLLNLLQGHSTLHLPYKLLMNRSSINSAINSHLEVCSLGSVQLQFPRRFKSNSIEIKCSSIGKNCAYLPFRST